MSFGSASWSNADSSVDCIEVDKLVGDDVTPDSPRERVDQAYDLKLMLRWATFPLDRSLGFRDVLVSFCRGGELGEVWSDFEDGLGMTPSSSSWRRETRSSRGSRLSKDSARRASTSPLRAGS